MATQDQVLQTKYHATKILRTATEGKCQQKDVTIVRILSACSALVKNIYIKRRDDCAKLQFNICKVTEVIRQ